MIQPINETNVQKKKRSELDPIWKRIYVERVWRVIVIVFFIFYIVQSITEYLHTNLGALAFAPLIIICGYIFNIINYFFIERYWRRIGQRRMQTLQIVQREKLPQSRKVVADENVLPVPTVLRLQWGKAYRIGLCIVLAILLLLTVVGTAVLLLNPNMANKTAVLVLIPTALAGVIVFFGVAIFFVTWRYQGQTIEITNEGIRTRYMRQERFIRWDEARLFASYGAQGINKNLLVETYELSNEETVVRWSQQQPGLALLTVQSDAGLKDDWNWLVGQVNALVHARTGLPLTDLGDNSQIPQWLAQRWTGEGRTPRTSVDQRAGSTQTPGIANSLEAAGAQTIAENESRQTVSIIGQNDPMKKRINNRQMLQLVLFFGIFGLVLLAAGIVGTFIGGNVWLISFGAFLIIAGVFFLICTLFIGAALRAAARYWYRVQQARQQALRQPHEFLAAIQPHITGERPASIQMWTKPIVNLLVTLALGLVLYTLFAFPFVHISNIGLRLLVSAGIALALSLFAAIFGVLASRRTRRQRVTISNDGISSRFGGVDSTMRWSDAAFFATYQGTNLWGRVNKKVRIYELASEQMVVRWQGVARMKYMDTQPKMDQQQFEQWQEQLKGYVVEKTGLPLVELKLTRDK